MSDGSSNRQAKSRGLSATATSGKRDGRRQRLLRDRVDEGEDCLCLVDRLRELNKLAHRLRVRQAILQIFKLRLLLALSSLLFEWFDILATGYG